jgi:cupin fold WbuC family metalloprotein|tara:strand:+ start:292 stop:831 length:540 start_codon:yes stop_codon:yes gene_type:complete
MNTIRFNEEVLYATDDVVKVDANDIEELKQKARQNPRRRIRICVHKDLDNSIHEMLIVHEKSCYVRPHKHIKKTESFHIIEGSVNIILYEKDGQINETIEMGAYSTGQKFFYRLPPSHYHTLLIESDVLVFHEITNGPFRPEDTVWAPWAPEETDKNEVTHYMKMLTYSVKEKSRNEKK